MPKVSCGVRTLRRLLRAQTFDVRGLDLAGFRRWLDVQLARLQNDPIFVQRQRIRDLQRSHPDLDALWQEHRLATAADVASAAFARLRWLDKERVDTAKAIAGLTAA